MMTEAAARPARAVRETAGAGVLPPGQAAIRPEAALPPGADPQGAVDRPGAAPIPGPRPGLADRHIGAAMRTGSGGRPMEVGILQEEAGGWRSSDW